MHELLPHVVFDHRTTGCLGTQRWFGNPNGEGGNGNRDSYIVTHYLRQAHDETMDVGRFGSCFNFTIGDLSEVSSIADVVSNRGVKQHGLL